MPDYNDDDLANKVLSNAESGDLIAHHSVTLYQASNNRRATAAGPLA